MNQYPVIERVRLSVEDAERLKQLRKFGLKKSTFVRNAIKEKLFNELPKLYSREKSNQNLIKLPF